VRITGCGERFIPGEMQPAQASQHRAKSLHSTSPLRPGTPACIPSLCFCARNKYYYDRRPSGAALVIGKILPQLVVYPGSRRYDDKNAIPELVFDDSSHGNGRRVRSTMPLFSNNNHSFVYYFCSLICRLEKYRYSTEQLRRVIRRPFHDEPEPWSRLKVPTKYRGHRSNLLHEARNVSVDLWATATG
jgi:hypothetical protein